MKWVLKERKDFHRWWWEGGHSTQKGQHEQNSRCDYLVGQCVSKVEHVFRAITGVADWAHIVEHGSLVLVTYGTHRKQY